jgi:hypothetical protein
VSDVAEGTAGYVPSIEKMYGRPIAAWVDWK